MRSAEALEILRAVWEKIKQIDRKISLLEEQPYKQNYKVVEKDLSQARDNEEIEEQGEFIIYKFSEAGCSAQIRLNEPNNDVLTLDDRIGVIRSPFYRFFLTNAAQSGKKLTLVVGRGKFFEWLSQNLIILDSEIAVPVDLQFASDDVNVKVREVHGSSKFENGTANGVADQETTVDIITVPSGEVYVFTRIEISSDSNVTSAQVLADGKPIDEAIGASSSQTIDYTKYPKGVKVTSKLSIKINSGATAGNVTYKTWRYETT